MKNYAIFYNWILKRRYNIKITQGKELLDIDGPRLYLPNHQAEVDPQILMSEIVKKHNVSPMVAAMYYNLPILNYYMKKLEAVPISDLDRGVRDLSVMDTIRHGASEAFSKGNSILLYPAGQLGNQGYEKIFNKQSAYALVGDINDEVRIIGVRMYGLWGSIWSRAWTGVSPSVFKTFFRSIFYFFANFVFFIPKRTVEIEFYDITEEAKQKAKVSTRREFNKYLEDFYNVRGEEHLRYIRHHFLSPPIHHKVPDKIKGIVSNDEKHIIFTKIEES